MSDLIKRAERFARERHAGQFRKGAAQEPYAVHLEEVATLTVKGTSIFTSFQLHTSALPF